MAFFFLLTDRGPQFDKKLFRKLLLELKLEHPTTAVYHPRVEVQGERY